jgi:hypothetical protein
MGKANMAKQRRQHYVPQFYLKYFTLNNSDQLFVLDKDNNKIFPKNVLEVCEQSYYYSYKETESDYEVYNYFVEDNLSKKENEFVVVFDKIIKNIEGYYYHSKKIDMLVRRDKLLFLEFLYYQIMRVPKYIDKLFINGVSFLKELNKKYNKVQTDKEMINDLKKIMFPKLFDSVHKFISIMNKRNWAFFIIDKNINEYFISSDNPVIILNSKVNVEKVGIIDPMTEISIPISKKILLSIRETFINYKLEYNIITSIDCIRTINTIIKDNSMRFIYSGIEDSLK